MSVPSFLQSPEWEQFERSLGRQTRRVDDILIIRRDLWRGLNYLYCPRPASVTEDFLRAAQIVAQQEKSIFLKIDPLDTIAFPASSIQCPASSVQPQQTIILDLASHTLPQLLAAMREKTRYNIRLSERKGVDVECLGPEISEKDFEIFWRLLEETARRDGFRTHPRWYYRAMCAARSDRFSNELFFARYEGAVIAGALVNFYRPAFGVPSATYLHGASARAHREVMSPQFLHWRIVEEAKGRGYAAYDFWGIDEERWPGVTRFKRGFGGREVVYPRSRDIVYRPLWYMMYAAAKRGRA